MSSELTLISLKTGPALEGIKTKLVSTQSKPKKLTDATFFSLEVQDLEKMLVEKIILTRIGIENDNYLCYALKNKNFKAAEFLIKNVYFESETNSQFINFQNSVGQTALHLAIRTGSYKFVKLVFASNLDKVDFSSPNF
jgi:hypothetical protein